MDDLEFTATSTTYRSLYAPEPVGIGTGMVESLASYLARLADSHWVNRVDLLTYLATQLSSERPASRYAPRTLVSIRSRQLNGMQQVASTWSSLVSQHTRHSTLNQLTLLPWSHLITPRQLTHTSQCWCPSCLEAWQSVGETIYWPLLWSVRAVRVCPQHQCPLEQHCPRCQAVISSLSAREAMGFCGKCHTWLGQKESAKPGQPEVVVSQTDIQTALGVLTLLQSATLPPETNTLEKVAGLIDWVCQTTAIHPPALATRLGLKRHLLYRMLAQEDLLNIPTLLAVVTGMGLEVRDFIQKPLADLVQSDPLKQFISSFFDQQRPAPTRLRPGQRVTPELLMEGKHLLEAALQKDTPPTLKQIAHQLGVKPNVLHRHFPQLCQSLLEKRRDQRDHERWRVRLAEIVNATTQPDSLTSIAAQLKTAPVTLHKYFPKEVALILERRHIIRDKLEFRQTVAAFLKLEPPLSLTEISRRLGLQLHHLRRHCPDLMQALVQRHTAYQQRQTLARAQQRATAVQEAVFTLNAQGQFPSKTKVAALLGKTHWLILNKKETHAFMEAMAALGLSPR